MTNPFDKLHSLRDEGEKRRVADQQFESSRTGYLIHRLKMSAHRNRLYRAAEERYGVAELRLDVFCETFQTFPFILGASRLGTPVHKDPHSVEPQRFKKFGNVPFVEAFKTFYGTVAAKEVRSVGLIFPRKGFTQGMVIHNDDTEKYWETGLCWVYKHPGSTERLYVQPLSALIEGIYRGGHGWKPTT